MKLSDKYKLQSILVAMAIYVVLVVLVGTILGVSLDQLLFGSVITGFLLGAFEEYYVQSRRGTWLRQLHPVLEITLHSLVILSLFFIISFITHMVFGRLDQLYRVHARLHIVIPAFIALSVVTITCLRVIGFIGGRNLFHLISGKYHRPVIEQRLFLFLDMKGSTKLVERLGAVKTREMIGQFFYDISQPITDHEGEIYRFTGDGMVAVWDFKKGVKDNQVILALDSIITSISSKADHYQKTFDQIPQFRIGVHGGDIVVCQEGSSKRAIGFYGETIHIAARLEQLAKEMNIDYLLSGQVVKHLDDINSLLHEIGELNLRGIKTPVTAYQLLPIN